MEMTPEGDIHWVTIEDLVKILPMYTQIEVDQVEPDIYEYFGCCLKVEDHWPTNYGDLEPLDWDEIYDRFLVYEDRVEEGHYIVIELKE